MQRRPTKTAPPQGLGDFPRPIVAVDVVLLTVQKGELHCLLIERTEDPYKDHWVLPGAFVRVEESLEAAATRVLAQKAKRQGVFLEQLYTFGSLERDPRSRVISVAYVALLAPPTTAPDTSSGRWARVLVPWEGETGGPVLLFESAHAPRRRQAAALELGFDHADIIGMAIKRLRGKLDYSPIGFQLLGERFTLLDLQVVHETILDRPLNKDSFRRKMLASGQLEASGEFRAGAGRPAELYRFARRSAL